MLFLTRLYTLYMPEICHIRHFKNNFPQKNSPGTGPILQYKNFISKYIYKITSLSLKGSFYEKDRLKQIQTKIK